MAIYRVVLRTAGVFTLAVAGWLVIVVASGRASRGHDLVALWSVVAVGSLGLAVLSMLATRAGVRLAPRTALALGLLGVVATVFGLFVLGSEMTPALSSDREGYLIAIGLILTVNGALALGWLVGRFIVATR